MSALVELAERCEAVTGPERLLDGEISTALYGDDWSEVDPRSMTDEELPRYTASLDAAMQLVPEGWRIDDMKENAFGEFWATLRPRKYKGGKPYVTAPGKSFALALTAAALRARAQNEGDDNG